MWLFGFALGAGLAVAFGTAREIATRLLVLDVVLLIEASAVVTRRRAEALLVAAGRRLPAR